MTRANWFLYLKTLRRIPDEIILDMGTRAFDMKEPTTCVCGWALRIAIAPILGRTAEMIDPEWDGSRHTTIPVPDSRLIEDGVTLRCGKFWGGVEEWEAVFNGVLPFDGENPYSGHLPEIERAFVERLDEAVRRAV